MLLIKSRRPKRTAAMKAAARLPRKRAAALRPARAALLRS